MREKFNCSRKSAVQWLRSTALMSPFFAAVNEGINRNGRFAGDRWSLGEALGHSSRQQLATLPTAKLAAGAHRRPWERHIPPQSISRGILTIRILLKNPSGKKATVKKTISDVSPDHSNRLQTKLARKNYRHFSYIFAHLQEWGVLQQNQSH